MDFVNPPDPPVQSDSLHFCAIGHDITNLRLWQEFAEHVLSKFNLSNSTLPFHVSHYFQCKVQEGLLQMDLDTTLWYFAQVAKCLTEIKVFCYRPQWSWAKVMFLQASVILSTGGGGSASVHAGIPTLLDQTPPSPPLIRHHPPDQTPPREADASIRSMSGRYASYWNAFLLEYSFGLKELSSSYFCLIDGWSENYW